MDDSITGDCSMIINGVEYRTLWLNTMPLFVPSQQKCDPTGKRKTKNSLRFNCVCEVFQQFCNRVNHVDDSNYSA